MIRPTSTFILGLLLSSTGLFSTFIPPMACTGLVGVGVVVAEVARQRRHHARR